MAIDTPVLRLATCLCGAVRCEAMGAPIVTAVCYCTDCQQGGATIEKLSAAPKVRDPDGGTPYMTYRDDRFACVAGQDRLIGYRNRDDSPTQRVVASCCNTGMFVKFAPGHWVSAYRMRFAGPLPPIEMRNKIKHRTSGAPIAKDAPAYRNFPVRLFWRLITARMAMRKAAGE